MKRRMLSVGLLGLVLVAVPALVAHAAKSDKSKSKAFKASCVMTGKAAKKDATTKFQGKDVYFCCGKCCGAFGKKASDKKVGGKLLAKVKNQWLETGQMVQVGCPISGKEVKKDHAGELNGTKVGFCCKNCKGKFAKASADEKLLMVFGKKSKGFTTQTKCPIGNKKIDPEVVTEHNGQKVYFCCPGCIKKFEKNPEKILAKINSPRLTFKSDSCCDKAQKNGDACGHGCCVKAAAAGKACSKCNAT